MSEEMLQPTENADNVNQTSESPQKNKGALQLVFDILEMFLWSVFAVLILFTFCFRLCRVEGHSMENTLYDGENLLVSELFYTPQQDDIIVFHLTDETAIPPLEKTLVKRVIATENQLVKIDFNEKKIWVDGVLYNDSHAVLKNLSGEVTNIYTITAEHHYDSVNKIFSATVPEGYIFVLGDNRNNSRDSRDVDIAFVDERCVLGKVLLRISPFKTFD